MRRGLVYNAKRQHIDLQRKFILLFVAQGRVCKVYILASNAKQLG
jgi:hypothetical protein